MEATMVAAAAMSFACPTPGCCEGCRVSMVFSSAVFNASETNINPMAPQIMAHSKRFSGWPKKDKENPTARVMTKHAAMILKLRSVLSNNINPFRAYLNDL